MKRLCLLALIPWIAQAKTIVIEEPTNDFLLSLSAGIESSYISEGRDQLNSGGILSTTLAATYRQFGFEVWYADAWDDEYSELNLTLVYSDAFGPVDLAAGYTFLRFFEDSLDDHELFVELSLPTVPLVTPYISWVYGNESGGSYAVAGLMREIEISDSTVVVPFVHMGLDAGYASDGREGRDHFHVGIEISHALTDHIELSGYLSFSSTTDHVRTSDEAGGDHFWGGVAVTWIF